MNVAWNSHRRRIFIPSWISRLDESMYVWMNKFTCPGFVFCPRKPHPKGNKYHTICCGESGIIYVLEIVEGRDHQIPMGRPEFYTSPNMKTVVLLLWITRARRNTGKAVILHSSLGFLKGVLEMRERGFYGSALIKIGNIGLGGFMYVALMINSGQKY